MKSARETAYDLLIKMEGGAFSNLALDGALSSSDMSERDRNFTSRLFIGVIERKLTLDHIISAYSRIHFKKLDVQTVIILRIGLYQILYMDGVPERAAVNESAELAKKTGNYKSAGFINGILRSFIRNGKDLRLPADKFGRLSATYSCGAELIKKWLSEYDEEDVLSLLNFPFEESLSYIRANIRRIKPEALAEKLVESGISAEVHNFVPGCLTVKNLGDPRQSELFNKGFFHVQDLSSQLCCMALAPEDGDIILDICAAPGGKAFTLSQMADCRITARDIREKRVGLIRKGAERLGISKIDCSAGDAAVFDGNLGLFDKVLCDAPCSGFGVIRSKPEIKYAGLDEIKHLPELQRKILETAAGYVKKGGTLVYSTCTVNRDENDRVIDGFLSERPDFIGESFLEHLGSPFGGYKATVFPRHFKSDGFFISKIKRISY